MPPVPSTQYQSYNPHTRENKKITAEMGKVSPMDGDRSKIRSIQYNDKSNSDTTQQSVTDITNVCKILYIFIKLTSNKTGRSRTTRFTGLRPGARFSKNLRTNLGKT